MREFSAMIMSICHTARVSSCMMIYLLLSHFVTKEYTFFRSETLVILLMCGQLANFVVKTMNFSLIPVLRQVSMIYMAIMIFLLKVAKEEKTRIYWFQVKMVK